MFDLPSFGFGMITGILLMGISGAITAALVIRRRKKVNPHAL
jgi:hypothetical protein